MARMRCYSPRTGHDHGTGVAGLALPLASGPAARRIRCPARCLPRPGRQGHRRCQDRPDRRSRLAAPRPGSAGTASIRGQEGAVVALRDAAERGQELRYREACDQPRRDDDPAKFDGERADSPEYGVDAHGASLQIRRVLEARRTPGRRWGSCRLVGRRWSSEATISQCPGYQEVGFSKSPARSLIIQMAPSGVTPVRGAPGGAQERAPPVSPSSPGRWGTLANVIRDSGRYRSEPCR
jgi:hypothetical protein